MTTEAIRRNRLNLQKSMQATLQNIPIKTFLNTKSNFVDHHVGELHTNNLIVQFLASFEPDHSPQDKTTLIKLRDFYHYYKKIEKLGEGSHGIILKCINLESQQIVAVKKFSTGDSQMLANLKKSFYVTKHLHNKYLRQTFQLFIDQNKQEIHLVTEYIDYPSLKSYIKHKKTVGQHNLKAIVRKILYGLKYLHSKGVTHRDIKPDNIMFNSTTKDLKLIDFEICKSNKNNLMWSMTGSLPYKAPQMFNGSGYNQEVDLWALGVTIFQIVTHKLPFENEYQMETIENILQMQLKFDQPEWKHYSKNLIILLKKLLNKNPEKRLTAAQSLRCAWMLENQSQHTNHFQSEEVESSQSDLHDSMHSQQPRFVEKVKAPHLMVQSISRCDLRKKMEFDIYQVPKQLKTRKIYEYS